MKIFEKEKQGNIRIYKLLGFPIMICTKKKSKKNKNETFKYDNDINMQCKVCGETAFKFTEKNVLNKYMVNYYHCPHCGHIQTQNPHWIEEAYSNAITGTDVGIITRNETVASNLTKILCKYFDVNAKYLEYAGGYGILTRKMRDIGFDFLWHDKYCENIFAQGFEYTGKEKIELLTAVEVFEHFENPIEDMEKLFNISDNIFFTQEIIPENYNDLKDWWYFCCEMGQHISFYSNETLDFIAEKFSKKHLYFGNLHLFTNKQITNKDFIKTLISKPYNNKKLKSKTWDDYLMIKEKSNNKEQA